MKLRTVDIHIHVYSSAHNKSNTLRKNRTNMASIMNHSHHLQLRKVCLVSLSSKNSPCITNRLVKLMSLSARPKDSPWNANNPNSISVRFGRSIGHFTNGGLLEIDTVITSEKHSAPTSIRSRALKSIPSSTRYDSHSQSSVRDSHRNRQRIPSSCPPPASSAHHSLHVTGRRRTHLAQRTPRTEHNSGFQYTAHSTPYSHAQ